MHIKTVFLILSALFMSACRGGYVAEIRHHDHSIPELVSFNIVDSYETNSEFEFGPYQITPYLDNGIFEVFWEVDSYHPYRVELFVNDSSQPDFGTRLSSAWCGRGEYCGNFSYQFCRYRENLSVVCELPESLETNEVEDISYLFTGIPEDLYLILEVCDEDLFYCEYDSIPVTFE